MHARSRVSSYVPILIAIGGATATGKTGLAIALAERLQGVILSADSRQVYRGFDIGTAKPTPQEQARVPHYLIDIREPTDTLTLATYQQTAQAIIADSHRQGTVPLLVGGTGLYLEAIVKGLKIPPVAPQPRLRSHFTQLGQPHSYQLLQVVDPTVAQRIHPNDAVRTQRALEVYYVTGQPISTLQGEVPPPYPVLYLGLDCDRQSLAQRIAHRTDTMIAMGLVAEVKALIDRYGPDLPLLRTLGYDEIRRYLAGDCSLAQAKQLIIQHTGQFAKRQRTWFRRRAPITWFDAEATDLLDQAWSRVARFMDATQAQKWSSGSGRSRG
nr:tRNA (adenosine(37)-N6)-dimethylallyltransferase MiaA [Halomicronema hongdechloris]